jgi:putative hemolysin
MTALHQHPELPSSINATSVGVAAFRPFSAGHLEVRLARSALDVLGAQRLRYRVFYEEMVATAAPAVARERRDFDRFDDICEHLVVVDRRGGDDRVVGTYRFLRREHAAEAGGFYSSAEYDIAPLLTSGCTLMELGRSCVDGSCRDRGTMQLLWRGIAEYVAAHRIDVMFGCGSLPGADAERHVAALSHLHHRHLAPAHLRATARPDRRANIPVLAPDSYDARAAVASLPPLIKGYFRIGGFVGDGAVVDAEFNTTDVFIIVKTELITGRYTRHYDLGGRPETGGAPSAAAH